MSKKLSLWDLYQRQDEIDQQLISHTHHYNDLTGFHSCASTGVADRALSADSANKVKNDLILKNSSGNNVNYNGSSQVDLSGGVYYAATAGTTKQSTNSDTVDNLHAYQMATLSETGNPNGTSHVLTCKYNTDRDGKFKFMTSNNIPVKCDYANNADTANTSDVSNKIKNTLILKNIRGTNVTFNGSEKIDLSEGVYYAFKSGNANTLDGYSLEQIKQLIKETVRQEGGDYTGKKIILIKRITLQNNSNIFNFENSKGGILRLTFKTLSARIILTVDDNVIINNETVNLYGNTIGKIGEDRLSEYIIPFERVVNIQNDGSYLEVGGIAYINK